VKTKGPELHHNSTEELVEDARVPAETITTPEPEGVEIPAEETIEEKVEAPTQNTTENEYPPPKAWWSYPYEVGGGEKVLVLKNPDPSYVRKVMELLYFWTDRYSWFTGGAEKQTAVCPDGRARIWLAGLDGNRNGVGRIHPDHQKMIFRWAEKLPTDLEEMREAWQKWMNTMGYSSSGPDYLPPLKYMLIPRNLNAVVEFWQGWLDMLLTGDLENDPDRGLFLPHR
jgi:hypothetical protein